MIFRIFSLATEESQNHLGVSETGHMPQQLNPCAVCKILAIIYIYIYRLFSRAVPSAYEDVVNKLIIWLTSLVTFIHIYIYIYIIIISVLIYTCNNTYNQDISLLILVHKLPSTIDEYVSLIYLLSTLFLRLRGLFLCTNVQLKIQNNTPVHVVYQT